MSEIYGGSIRGRPAASEVRNPPADFDQPIKRQPEATKTAAQRREQEEPSPKAFVSQQRQANIPSRKDNNAESFDYDSRHKGATHTRESNHYDNYAAKQPPETNIPRRNTHQMAAEPQNSNFRAEPKKQPAKTAYYDEEDYPQTRNPVAKRQVVQEEFE